MLAVALTFIIGGAIGVWYARVSSNLQKLLKATPTSCISNLSAGQFVEVKGTVDCQFPLKVPGSERKCVYYSYELQRRERKRNSNSITEYEWHTIKRGEDQTPFILKDESGSIDVNLLGAEIEAEVILDQLVDPLKDSNSTIVKAFFYMSQLTAGIHERIIVKAIELGSDVYCLGTVLESADGKLRIGRGTKRFFLSTSSEEQVKNSTVERILLGYILGGAAILFGVYLLFVKN
ncbi:MAG: E3 ubiquitin ligase family protein [Candidatus Omnitrophica bacterium]|nr:E3 ubiquitin ligase family protein [Candidatus Omnitrophota bacterium]